MDGYGWPEGSRTPADFWDLDPSWRDAGDRVSRRPDGSLLLALTPEDWLLAPVGGAVTAEARGRAAADLGARLAELVSSGAGHRATMEGMAPVVAAHAAVGADGYASATVHEVAERVRGREAWGRSIVVDRVADAVGRLGSRPGSDGRPALVAHVSRADLIDAARWTSGANGGRDDLVSALGRPPERAMGACVALFAEAVRQPTYGPDGKPDGGHAEGPAGVDYLLRTFGRGTARLLRFDAEALPRLAVGEGRFVDAQHDVDPVHAVGLLAAGSAARGLALADVRAEAALRESGSRGSVGPGP